jgi:hypothetical protein
LSTHLRHGRARIEQRLRLRLRLPSHRESMPLARHRRHEEARRTELAELFASPLHRDEGHRKSPRHLRLRGQAIGNELTGKEPERNEVIDGMREHRQMAIEVKDHPIALLESEFGSDGTTARREEGKLNLGHQKNEPPTRQKRKRSSSEFFPPNQSTGAGQDV